MYYSVLIEATEKNGKPNEGKQYFEFDKSDLAIIKTRIVEPYLRKDSFRFDGFDMSKKEITRIKIKQTENETSRLAECETSRMQSNVLMRNFTRQNIFSMDKYATDITDLVIDEVEASISSLQNNKGLKQMAHEIDYSKIFIVHGRDDLAKIEVARFLECLGLTAIILHEQASGNKTIIEKLEANTNVGFAIVLYTPCDEGNLVSEPLKPRTRQNVIFEHGYLIGKLGRNKVCALVKGEVEIPSDINSLVHIPFDENEGWHKKIVKELREAGYEIDANKIF